MIDQPGHSSNESSQGSRLGLCRFTKTYIFLIGFITISFFLAPALLPKDYVSEIGEEKGRDNQANRVNFAGDWNRMARDGHYYEAAIYYFGDFNCHQLPERSYRINGNQQPVCARDVGMFLGGTLGAILLLRVIPSPEMARTALSGLPGGGRFLLRRMKPMKSVFVIAVLLLAPLTIDGLYQLLTDYESNNTMRVITGVFFGFGFFYGMGAMMASSMFGFPDYSDPSQWPLGPSYRMEVERTIDPLTAPLTKDGEPSATLRTADEEPSATLRTADGEPSATLRTADEEPSATLRTADGKPPEPEENGTNGTTENHEKRYIGESGETPEIAGLNRSARFDKHEDNQ